MDFPQMQLDRIAAWPGKTYKEAPGLTHPAFYHMLDVAAVAEVLLCRSGLAIARRQALILLIALHDLGKISASFRDRLLHGIPQIQGAHWEVTEALLRHHDDALNGVLRIAQPRWRFSLYAASAGHHGRPPKASADKINQMLKAAGVEAVADAGRIIGECAALWPEASLADLSRDEMLLLTWLLPGLIAVADWIGSNAAWFPAQAPVLLAKDYLEAARGRACEAVTKAGFLWPAASDRSLFNFDLRPMQKACAAVTLRDGPMLAFIEDETGAGKTEAAWILAQRMLLAGKGRGLFCALPTMATADAMFGRAKNSIARMFMARPSLTLAHGRAGLSVAFRDLVGRAEDSPDAPGCSNWLAEDRRRALLADVGVGTIDQALMAVLPVRHSCLRLFGLSSKILIVDEVHEMGDPYLAELLVTLLRVHASLGGSAILLTATLPLGLRARLVQAFEEGAGRATPAPQDRAYPALTVAGGETHPLPARTGARGAVKVERLDCFGQATDLLEAQAKQGAACLWVRNAVDEAIGAVQALRERGVQADLLHARFALSDRKRHEAAALDRFGKEGVGRSGRVLVATQVVESSLDMDFDLIVSDLAPMAALIQRMGRMWRHMDRRPAKQRSTPAPVLHVLSPDPGQVRDARWLHGTLGAGAQVYPLALQWRTADVLFRAGRIEPPGELRALIEAVHGQDAADIPAVLLKADWEWTKHGGHAARFLFATVSRPSRTAALVTATR